MKVLNLSSNDYANFSHLNADALRSVGVSCLDWTTNLHPFGYDKQSEKVSYSHIEKNYKNFDVIQVFHSCPTIYKIVKDHPNVIIYHTGSRYRESKETYDELFKGRTIVTDQCEFLLHNHEFIYLAPHTTLKPVEKRKDGKLILGHFPSNPRVKGTDDIRRLLAPFEDDFEIRIDEAILPHEENLKRIAECHIYVELFKPELNGKPYGCFGVTAFEATALGCLVVTNNINPDAYEWAYGYQPFLTPNTEQKFINTIISLGQDREMYDIAVETFHRGFYQKHGITEAGLRIKKIIDESKGK